MSKNSKKPIHVAIYSRFSTSNQSEHSIEDQVRECRKYVSDQGQVVKPEHIFSDRRKSGTNTNRRDLDRLRAAAMTGAFEKVIVLNLARLTRELMDLLFIQAELAELGIEIVSVQEGVESFNEDSEIDIHLRGLINQYNISSIRKETRRGQVGNIERGFLAGGLGYGYKTKRTGVITVDANGRERGEGSVPEVIEDEAAVIRRIYDHFIGGKSITQIVKTLNAEHVPARRGKGWNESTVSKILKCETYTGKYTWGRTTNRRNRATGKLEKRKQPQEKWIIREWESLRIIDDEIWTQAQTRWAKIKKTFSPDDDGNGGGRGSGWPGHRGYNETNPKHLLSGVLRCGVCNGSINLVSGKRGGYYGCQMAQRKRCSNARLIRRQVIEEAFLAELRVQVLNPAAIREVAMAVDTAIRKRYAHLPSELSSKNRELDQVRGQLANLVGFVAAGNISPSVGMAIQQAEGRERILKEEIQHIKAAQLQIPKPPTDEHIKERLKDLGPILRGNVTKAAELIRGIIGEAKLEPKKDENGRDYLDFSSVFRALALLSFFSSDGSNFYEKWRWGESNPRPRSH
jgi:site-specific DNA recombinase